VDAASCAVVPEDISDAEAVWFALAKIAFVGARAAGHGLGAHVVIAGAGPIGQMAARWAVAAGAADVIVVDPVLPRLALAAAGGATATVAAPLEKATAAITEQLAGRSPEIVIDTTGNAAVFADALRIVADHGRVVVLGDTGAPSRQRLTSDVITRGVTVVGAHDRHTSGDPRFDHDREIYRLFFRLVAARRFSLDGLSTHTYSPRDCAAAYSHAEHSRGDTLGIVFDWAAAPFS
jgi:threonine dehydrogenase-like Zn-dependent dehydrogenase